MLMNQQNNLTLLTGEGGGGTSSQSHDESVTRRQTNINSSLCDERIVECRFNRHNNQRSTQNEGTS